MQQNKSGFTIVELLIVIVVIAILAAITVVAYNGLQARSQDASRTADVKNILKVLEAYKIENGQYPVATSSTGNSGWHESSTDTGGTFMEYLVPTYFSKTPVDPINDGTHYWRYYRYNAGSNGCPGGAFYTFEVFGYASASNKPESMEPLVCPFRTWDAFAGPTTVNYFTYKFES